MGICDSLRMAATVARSFGGVVPDSRRGGAHGRQELRGRGAGFRAALGRELVDQTIRQRVAERHAQLEHIDAKLIERQRQLPRGFQVRITRADIDDKPFLVLVAQPRETFDNAIHAAAECLMRLNDSTDLLSRCWTEASWWACHTRRNPSKVNKVSTAVISGSLEAISCA